MRAVRLDLQKVNYGDRSVLEDIQITLGQSQRLGVIGPSGVGKSTILKVISGLHTDFQGTLEVFDRTVTERSIAALREEMAFLFQQSPLIGDLTVYDNLLLALTYSRFTKDECRAKILKVLQGVELLAAKDMYPDELSGGMRRRVVIAIALLKEPKLLLCDEPFTGQDPLTKMHLLQLLDQLQKEYKFAMILVSHDVKETLELCPQTAVIMGGKLCALGAKQDLLAAPDERVVEFVERGL